MIVLYSGDTTDFDNNGVGILTDAIITKTTEELNGRYDVEVEYLITGQHAEKIEINMILKVNVATKNPQLFRIKNIEKNLKTMYITAYHITYDMNNNFLVDVAPTNQTCLGALEWVLARTEEGHSFSAKSDIATLHTARYVRKNLMEAIAGADNSILNVWGGELDRDNFQITINNEIGKDNGYKIIYGKNLREIKWSIDMTEVTTKILPQGRDALLLPELFIESPIADNYPSRIIRKIEFEDIGINENPEDEETPITYEQACEMLRAEVQKLFDAGIDKPIVNIEIDMIELSKTEEYKDKYQVLETISIGDIVTAYIPEINVDVKLKVIAIVYDSLKEKIETITLGQRTGNYFEKQEQTTISRIDDIKNIQIPTALKTAKETATGLINSAMGGFVYKTNSELYIMDSDNLLEAKKVWRWNINGLAYSSTGVYGEYQTAITADGQIVADFITAGKLRGDIIEAGSISINSISTGATDKMVVETGLENLIKNSSGLNSYTYWTITGSNPTSVNTPDVKENTEAEMGFQLSNTIMTQNVSIMQGNTYTIALRVKKGTGTSTIKIVQANKEELILSAGVNETFDWKTITKTFTATGNLVTISIANQNDYLIVADIILIDGGYPKVWSPAYRRNIYTKYQNRC